MGARGQWAQLTPRRAPSGRSGERLPFAVLDSFSGVDQYSGHGGPEWRKTHWTEPRFGLERRDGREINP